MPDSSPPRPSRGTALVTGASSGIGLELARVFAARGFDLVLVARSEGRLREIAAELQGKAGRRVDVLAHDLGDPAAPEAVFSDTEAAGLTVDVLVNNAGYASFGPFAEAGLANQTGMIDLNARALTALTRLYLPGMLARRRGRILNLASTASFLPGPLMAVYYATKAYVLSFSEALAEEVRGQGVTVTALCPGPTRSGFQERAGMQRSRLMAVVDRTAMDAATVARAGYTGLMKGDTVVIPGASNRLLPLAARALPRRLLTRIARRAQEPVSE